MQTRAMLLEREAQVTKCHGDAAHISTLIDEVKSAWEDIGDRTEKKLKIIWKNVGSDVKDDLECAPQAVQEDPELLLARVSEQFGDTRTLDELQK